MRDVARMRLPACLSLQGESMGVIGPRLKIDHRKETYEGLNAMSAVIMAFAESTGIRELIDATCTYDRTRRILSPGMGAKCMMGPVMWLGCKLPLVRVERNYAGVPCDLIFGEGIVPANLNDDALGRCLDTLAREDLTMLVHRSSDMCVKRFGFESQVRHDDGSNYKFYGEEKDVPEGEIYPALACHPKDGRHNTLHYCFQLSADENGILRLAKAHRGNITDIEADRDTIDFFGKVMDIAERRSITYVADSKAVTAETVGMLKDYGIRFVSKCPVNFGTNLRERALNAAEAASCCRSASYPDLEVFDCVLSVRGKKNESDYEIRAVVCFSDASVRKEMHKARAKRRKVEDRILEYIDVKRWGSVEELENALSLFDLPANCRLDYDIGTFEVPGKSDHRGRRRKDEVVPPMTLHFVKRLWVHMDEESALADARRASAAVLVTDIPCTESDRKRYREGMTADGIIRLYREEYRVEHCIRFTKSGVGIDQVFLQTPSRERAMMFVVSELTMLTSTADAVFRSRGMKLNGVPMTVNNLMQELQGTTVRLDRSEMRMFVESPQGKEIDLFEITDALQINPRLLLGYLES